MVNAERAHGSSSLTRFTDLRSVAKLYSYQYKRAQVKKRRARTFKPIANYLIKRIADCSLARCTDLRLYHLKSGRWVFHHGASKFHIILSQECLSLQFPENILVAQCLRVRASRQRVRPRRRRAILMRRFVFKHIHLLLVALLLFFDPLHTIHCNGLLLLSDVKVLSDPLNVSATLCFFFFHCKGIT